jgi:4-amino-4-deoxy-L-arabinose transferase-like glycosyltransferase
MVRARGQGFMAAIFGEQARHVAVTDPIGRVLAFAAARHGRAILLLVVVSLIAFLPGFFQLPPTDRDESRFAQATKQMVESGDFIDIRFQDEVRYKKPVGIYWLQAGAVLAGEAFGVPAAQTRIWLYRIPSLLGAIGAVLATYWAALAFVPRRHALLAGLMLAGSILLNVEARIAKTDAMLLFTITLAAGALARAYLGRHGETSGPGFGIAAVFWTALAAGVLLKGPVIVLIMGLTVASLVIADRSVRWLMALRPMTGALWFGLLVLPWFVAILGRAGDSFLAESVGRDMLPKLFSPQEGHGAPPGFYLLLFWLTFWPAAPLAALAAPAAWDERRERPVRFLLAWLVPAWIAFELFITKLPHYVLPLYPAIAILTARAIWHGTLSETVWLKRGTLWWPVLAVLIPVAVVVALVVLRHQLGLLAWPFGAAAMILGYMAWRLYDTDGPETSLVRAVLASVLIMITALGFIVPSLRPLFPSATLARLLPVGDCEYRLVATAGYYEPSLVFLLGTATRFTDGTGAADHLRDGPCRFALVEQRQERAFVQRAEQTGLRYTSGPRIDGINYNGGRALSIAVYRSGTP